MVVPFRIGDIFRPSRAAPDARVLNNLPGCYPVENWHACYWTVCENGVLQEYAVILQLPQGYAAACAPVRVGQPGCILHVRRWGVACRLSPLEAIAFDPITIAGSDASDETLMEVCFAATQFDLPGGFVIADPDYPFLLFDSQGVLKGSSVDGISLLGALAFFASGGRVASDFQQLRREAPSLYRRAVAEMMDILKVWAP
ncbi:MAG: hypothetical protein D6793_01335 [Thermoflexia bacterium]|nr:MAG: hypothetical protein D6793_01335 [Thermoflexia bacterium]